MVSLGLSTFNAISIHLLLKRGFGSILRLKSILAQDSRMANRLSMFMTKDMIWKIALAIVGCIAVGFIYEEVISGLIGWMICGAVLAGTCYPLFKTLFERRGMKLGR